MLMPVEMRSLSCHRSSKLIIAPCERHPLIRGREAQLQQLKAPPDHHYMVIITDPPPQSSAAPGSSRYWWRWFDGGEKFQAKNFPQQFPKIISNFPPQSVIRSSIPIAIRGPAGDTSTCNNFQQIQQISAYPYPLLDQSRRWLKCHSCSRPLSLIFALAVQKPLILRCNHASNGRPNHGLRTIRSAGGNAEPVTIQKWRSPTSSSKGIAVGIPQPACLQPR